MLSWCEKKAVWWSIGHHYQTLVSNLLNMFQLYHFTHHSKHKGYRVKILHVKAEKMSDFAGVKRLSCADSSPKPNYHPTFVALFL